MAIVGLFCYIIYFSLKSQPKLFTLSYILYVLTHIIWWLYNGSGVWPGTKFVQIVYTTHPAIYFLVNMVVEILTLFDKTGDSVGGSCKVLYFYTIFFKYSGIINLIITSNFEIVTVYILHLLCWLKFESYSSDIPYM